MQCHIGYIAKSDNIHTQKEESNLNITNETTNMQVYVNKGNNKITELRTILQRESPNS